MTAVLTDERLPADARYSLSALGFDVILLPAAKALAPSALEAHTDILMFRHGKRVITSATYARENTEIFRKLNSDHGAELILSERSQERKYPFDAIFNALLIGNRLFCKTDTVDPLIIKHARECGAEIIHTNQGYPACTVLPLSDNAAITADRGMAKLLEKCGIRTYVISDSDKIKLPPYEYGFIGGCAGVYKSTVYFTGSPDDHPSCDIIKSAILKEGLEYAALSRGPLVDVGGLVFFE